MNDPVAPAALAEKWPNMFSYLSTMKWSLPLFLRTYGGLLTTWLVLGLMLWYEYSPGTYVRNISDVLPLITPALCTVRNAHLVLFFVVSFVWIVLLWLSPGRLVLRAGIVVLGAGWWLTERGFRQYFAAEYYTIWKYQVVDKLDYQPLHIAHLVPSLLQDVQNPAEPFRVRAKLVFALGHAGIQPAVPVLETIVHAPDQDPRLRFYCLQSLRLLHPQRLAALIVTMPTDSAVTLYRQHERRYN